MKEQRSESVLSRRERRSLQGIPNYLLLWAKPNVHTNKLIELCSAINTGMLKPQKAERSIYLHNSLSSHSSACEKCFHLSALPDSNWWHWSKWGIMTVMNRGGVQHWFISMHGSESRQSQQVCLSVCSSILLHTNVPQNNTHIYSDALSPVINCNQCQQLCWTEHHD